MALFTRLTRILGSIFLFLCISQIPYAQETETFFYGYTNYDNYRVESIATQKMVGEAVDRFSEITINMNVKVAIQKREEGNFVIQYDTEILDGGKLESTESSHFVQYKSGLMDVDEQYETPLARSIPQFPSYSLSRGDSWVLQGYDNILLPESTEYTLVPVYVEYTYLGYGTIPEYEKNAHLQEKEGEGVVSAPMIRIHYEIHDKKILNSNIAQNQILNASFDMVMWWNQGDNRMEYYEENYQYDIIYEAYNSSLSFQGSSQGWMIGVDALNKDIDAIQEALPDVQVTKNEKGITLSIQNIQFLSDSAILQLSEQKKLNEIAQVLANYKDRRILVEGHTARIGSSRTQQQLSEARALAVVDYLEQLIDTSRDSFLYQGWGGTRPLMDNNTERGKAQNRRVEITILEN